jgi:hypothetical protein
MRFDIELSKDEVAILERLLENSLSIPNMYQVQQTIEILTQKIKFMKLIIHGHSLEVAANLLHLAEVPDYAPERADAWHDEDLTPCEEMNRRAQGKNLPNLFKIS